MTTNSTGPSPSHSSPVQPPPIVQAGDQQTKKKTTQQELKTAQLSGVIPESNKNLNPHAVKIREIEAKLALESGRKSRWMPKFLHDLINPPRTHVDLVVKSCQDFAESSTTRLGKMMVKFSNDTKPKVRESLTETNIRTFEAQCSLDKNLMGFRRDIWELNSNLNIEEGNLKVWSEELKGHLSKLNATSPLRAEIRAKILDIQDKINSIEASKKLLESQTEKITNVIATYGAPRDPTVFNLIVSTKQILDDQKSFQVFELNHVGTVLKDPLKDLNDRRLDLATEERFLDRQVELGLLDQLSPNEIKEKKEQITDERTKIEKSWNAMKQFEIELQAKIEVLEQVKLKILAGLPLFSPGLQISSRIQYDQAVELLKTCSTLLVDSGNPESVEQSHQLERAITGIKYQFTNYEPGLDQALSHELSEAKTHEAKETLHELGYEICTTNAEKKAYKQFEAISARLDKAIVSYAKNPQKELDGFNKISESLLREVNQAIAPLRDNNDRLVAFVAQFRVLPESKKDPLKSNIATLELESKKLIEQINKLENLHNHLADISDEARALHGRGNVKGNMGAQTLVASLEAKFISKRDKILSDLDVLQKRQDELAKDLKFFNKVIAQEIKEGNTSGIVLIEQRIKSYNEQIEAINVQKEELVVKEAPLGKALRLLKEQELLSETIDHLRNDAPPSYMHYSLLINNLTKIRGMLIQHSGYENAAEEIQQLGRAIEGVKYQAEQYFTAELVKSKSWWSTTPRALYDLYSAVQDAVGSNFAIPIEQKLMLIELSQDKIHYKGLKELVQLAVRRKQQIVDDIVHNKPIIVDKESQKSYFNYLLEFNLLADLPLRYRVDMKDLIQLLQEKSGESNSTLFVTANLVRQLTQPTFRAPIAITTTVLTEGERYQQNGYVFYPQRNIWVKTEWRAIEIPYALIWQGNFALKRKDGTYLEKRATADIFLDSIFDKSLSNEEIEIQGEISLKFIEKWCHASDETRQKLEKEHPPKLVESAKKFASQVEIAMAYVLIEQSSVSKDELIQKIWDDKKLTTAQKIDWADLAEIKLSELITATHNSDNHIKINEQINKLASMAMK